MGEVALSRDQQAVRRRPRPGATSTCASRTASSSCCSDRRAAARRRRCASSRASSADRRPRASSAGTDVTRRPPREPRRRHGVPELRALPAPDRRPRTSPTRCKVRKVDPRPSGRRPSCGSRRVARGGPPPRRADRASSPAANASGSPSRGRSSANPPRSSWTSRCPTSTRSCALTMRGEIKRLQQRLGTTTLYVTHDQAEALTMADRVCLLSGRSRPAVRTRRRRCSTARRTGSSPSSSGTRR